MGWDYDEKRSSISCIHILQSEHKANGLSGQYFNLDGLIACSVQQIDHRTKHISTDPPRQISIQSIFTYPQEVYAQTLCVRSKTGQMETGIAVVVLGVDDDSTEGEMVDDRHQVDHRAILLEEDRSLVDHHVQVGTMVDV